MRSYTLREVQSTRASPPSRHIYPRDNGDTREKESPFPRRVKAAYIGVGCCSAYE